MNNDTTTTQDGITIYQGVEIELCEGVYHIAGFGNYCGYVAYTMSEVELHIQKVQAGIIAAAELLKVVPHKKKRVTHREFWDNGGLENPDYIRVMKAGRAYYYKAV